MPQALLLTGSGGVGKTTTAQAIAAKLTTAGHRTGVVDLDAISQFGPPAPQHAAGLRFHDRLRISNLAAIWTTYRAAGADYLIVSGHVETPELHTAYVEALQGCDVRMIKLTAAPELIAERTRLTRGPGWDLEAALAEAGNHVVRPDFTVRNDGPVTDTAMEVLTKLGWLSC